MSPDRRVTLLRLESVSKSFGSLKVVDSVDLALEPGIALGIVGPNGAGKTTLFNLVSGALSPDSGRIRFDARDITHDPPHKRCVAGIARTFQIPHPFARLTVFENLLVAATHARKLGERDAAQACGEIVERTGLMRAANRVAGSLTLLDRKRLELSRALATGPRLLLLDEIAGGLTEAECAELIATIGEIKRSGVTIVWIEHVVHALLAVADRLAVLDFGRKIAEGEPKAVMDSAEVREIYLGMAA
jgi:branched-chain amino acid transport system ATP-binding protein